MRFFPPQGLWHHKDFLKFWTGETISAFGSQVTAFALPITAALILHATAIQMGVLSFLAFAPMVFLSLFAGVIVDRFPRRPVLIITSLGQVVSIGTIPFLAFLHLLRLEYLYAIALLSGCLSVFFEIAYQAYLPSLVEHTHLLEGNEKLEMSHACAQIVGPGLAGLVVQWLNAPLAMLIDACSFLVAALFLSRIKKPELRKVPQKTELAVFKEISEGLRSVLHHRVLWSIAACNGTINLFNSAFLSIAVLYIVRDLKIAPVMYGFVLSMGSVGALAGSFLAKRIADRFGVGPTIIVSAFFFGVGSLFLPLAGVSTMMATPFLILSWFVQSLTLIIFNITQVSFRQGLLPEYLQGRLNASMRFLICSTLPIGSILGGAVGEAIGLFPTVILSSIGMLLAFLWVFFSPLSSLREQPVQHGQ
ncbi:MFS transporter [Dictyobacter alpinus]|uniref:MFS transporter n=1 Tax=Dictyobacter alpinus TaxID=2014873 RepID=A0A402BF47_9CHLR|nr:MFS transporter [Dictyobacter alpinus]GCE30003.1 MFS transporter [Dictyobacter alpinus]